MPRVTLTKTTPKGPFPTLPVAADSLDAVITVADVANMEQFVPSGDDLIIAHNSDGASARTITITSAPDAQGRSSDITTYSIGIGEIAVFRINKKKGWVQTDGRIYINASNAAVRWIIVNLG